jgi:hypothetical protein
MNLYAALGPEAMTAEVAYRRRGMLAVAVAHRARRLRRAAR